MQRISQLFKPLTSLIRTPVLHKHTTPFHKPLSSTAKQPSSHLVSLQKDNIIEISGSTPLKLHSLWLRDHCRCSSCYHEATKQRLMDTAAIPINIHPLSMKLNENHLSVHWSDAHQSTYPLSWLHNVTQPRPKQQEKHLWDHPLNLKALTTDYHQVMHTDQGLSHWLQNIHRYGIGFVNNVPVNPQDTEKLCKRIAFIRETHYGGFWDFSPNLEHGDTAYTTIALPAHTDTTYFTDPIGLQLFHLLEHRGTGGESLYVDGFHCAAQLKTQSPTAYATLSELRIPTAHTGDAHVLITPTPHAFPILNHHPLTGELFQIRFNNDDRSVLNTLTSSQIKDFYAALREWIRILRTPTNELWTQLKPGTLIAVDNWRVLHGRAAFTGYRRMVGCYINHDDYLSRFRTVCLKSKEKEYL